MSDRIEFLLKYGRPSDVANIVHNHRQYGIDNKEWAIHTVIKHNASVSPDLLDHAIKYENHNLKAMALKHPNLSAASHTKALAGSDPDVREAALLSHHTTVDQLTHHSTKDPDPDVRRIAGNILRNRRP